MCSYFPPIVFGDSKKKTGPRVASGDEEVKNALKWIIEE
jgi:hypothetical protein